jgi:hypothetical protein
VPAGRGALTRAAAMTTRAVFSYYVVVPDDG